MTDGPVLCTIAASTVDQSHTSLTLIGQGAEPYGQSLNNNLVHLISNFADTTSPVNPLVGQIWYSTAFQFFNVWNGTAWIPLRPDTPPNNAGIATVLLGTSPSIIGLLSDGALIATVCDQAIAQIGLRAHLYSAKFLIRFLLVFLMVLTQALRLHLPLKLSPSDNSDALVTSKWVNQQISTIPVGPTGPAGPAG